MAITLIRVRRTLGVLLSLLLAGFVVTGVTSSAQAVDGYRYWNYFHLEDGHWAFSKVGAGDYVPADGAVEGYRFGTSTTAKGIPPRADLAKVNFRTICGGSEAAAGEKRVAVVIDYGTAADADGATPPDPRAACAVVDKKADGLQVLEAVAEVRSEKGLTCALDGYPVRGCGEAVSDAKPVTHEQRVAFDLPATGPSGDASAAGAAATGASTDAATQDDGNPLVWPLVAVAVVIAAIAAAGLRLSRRNRSA
jgi:hypothetical protein